MMHLFICKTINRKYVSGASLCSIHNPMRSCTHWQTQFHSAYYSIAIILCNLLQNKNLKKKHVAILSQHSFNWFSHMKSVVDANHFLAWGQNELRNNLTATFIFGLLKPAAEFQQLPFHCMNHAVYAYLEISPVKLSAINQWFAMQH